MAETFVYKDNEKIKGFISVINKEFIGALFVHTDFQGTGVGKELINYAIDKYNNLELAVYKRNGKAVKFYEKLKKCFVISFILGEKCIGKYKNLNYYIN